MQANQSNKHSEDFEDEIDFIELFKVLWDGKWIIIFLTTFVSIVGVIYSLSLPNIYTSKALLVPVNPSSSIPGSSSRICWTCRTCRDKYSNWRR